MKKIKITLPPERSGIAKEEYIKECINYMKNVEKCCRTFIDDAPEVYDWGGIEIAMEIHNRIGEMCNDLLRELHIIDETKFIETDNAILMLEYAIKEKEMIQIIEEIVYQYLDVKLLYLAEFKDEWEIILQDKFDHKKRFKQQVNNIAYALEDFSYAGVTQHKLEDDEDKIMLTFEVILGERNNEL